MTIEIKVPVLPESVADATIATWHVKSGDTVSRDQNLVDIETDKVVIEVVSPSDGVLKEILKNTGDTIVSNEAIGVIEAGEVATAAEAPAEAEPEKAEVDESVSDAALLSPAARKLAEENSVDVSQLQGSGKDGRVTKEDVMAHIGGSETQQGSVAAAPTAPVFLEKSYPL